MPSILGDLLKIGLAASLLPLVWNFLRRSKDRPVFVSSKSNLYVAGSIFDATRALSDSGKDGVPLAGGTWLMRAPIRGERPHRLYVALDQIAELHQVEILANSVAIGACATHVEVADALAALPECAGLVTAVRAAANPAIRQVATIGGNLCAGQFAASDVVPALMCLDAEVDLHSPDRVERLPLAQFLGGREHLRSGTLLVRIVFTLRQARYAHIRLPLRKAGDYPVAIVSAAANVRPDGLIDDLRIAVGSVEPAARRWSRLELMSRGCLLNADAMGSAAEVNISDFTGRDGVEAEGWYRTQVLPTLVRRAARALLKQA